MILSVGITPGAIASALTWDDCVRLMIANNKELQAQERTSAAAEFRYSGAANPYFPEVSANLSYSQNQILQLVTTNTQGYSAGLLLKQNLFAGFRDISNRDWAKAQTRIVDYDTQILKARLSKDLKVAFEAYLFALRSIELRKSIVKRRQDNVRLVDLRFRGGRENRGSVSLSQANLSEARFEESQAQLWLQQSRVTLAKFIGVENPETLEVIGNVPVSEPPSGNANLKQMAETTPKVLRAFAVEEQATAGLGVARANFFPTLGIEAGIRQADNRFFPQENREAFVAASVNIPLFNGGRDYFETKAQNENVLAAAHSKDQAVRESFDLLQTALSNYIQAVERVKVNEAFVEAANIRAEIGRMRYNNGLISFEDWYYIENELIDRQKKVLEARRDRVQLEALWEEAQGKGVLQ